jgi:hypothetical protein
MGCTLGRRAGSLLMGAGLLGAAVLGGASAFAIPEAAAIKKLEVIPVFVITDEKGVPLPIPKDNTLILPLYLERSKAQSELAGIQKNNPKLKAGVVGIPLNVMNDKVLELNKQLKDKSKKLVAPVVVNPSDRQEAIKLLKAQGLTDQQINEGLSVPVFFTKPFLTVQTPEGPRGVFFFSYAELQKGLAKVPNRDQLKPQVADLSAVLREIIKAKDDSYVIFPTPDYFRLVQENQGKGTPAAK